MALEGLKQELHWINSLPWGPATTKHQTPARCPHSRNAWYLGFCMKGKPRGSPFLGLLRPPFGVNAIKFHYETSLWWGTNYKPLSRQAQGQPTLYWILKYHKLFGRQALGYGYKSLQWEQPLPTEYVSEAMHCANYFPYLMYNHPTTGIVLIIHMGNWGPERQITCPKSDNEESEPECKPCLFYLKSPCTFQCILRPIPTSFSHWGRNHCLHVANEENET